MKKPEMVMKKPEMVMKKPEMVMKKPEMGHDEKPEMETGPLVTMKVHAEKTVSGG